MLPPNIEQPLMEADKVIAPVRTSLFKRFPTLFTLIVTFGVGATFFGIERVFATIPLFNEHPWFTLTLGLVLLGVTGKLYAKLG
jgi:hypothetical protein